MYKSRYKKASSRIAKRNKARKSVSIFLKTSLPVVFLVGLVFLLRADFLQVRSFEVNGAEAVQVENIKNTALGFASGRRFFLIPKSNIFLLDKEALAAAILSAFPRLEKVSVNKQFFGKSITLSLAERGADFLWCSAQEECYFMDNGGLVFEKLDSDLSNSYPASLAKIIFRGVLEGSPLMKNFASRDKMRNYIDFSETLKQAGFEVGAINIESKDKAVAKSKIGDIIFNPDEVDLPTVAQNVILLIGEEKSKNPSASFQYIDARFGNKLFYKLL